MRWFAIAGIDLLDPGAGFAALWLSALGLFGMALRQWPKWVRAQEHHPRRYREQTRRRILLALLRKYEGERQGAARAYVGEVADEAASDPPAYDLDDADPTRRRRGLVRFYETIDELVQEKAPDTISQGVAAVGARLFGDEFDQVVETDKIGRRLVRRFWLGGSLAWAAAVLLAIALVSAVAFVLREQQSPSVPMDQRSTVDSALVQIAWYGWAGSVGASIFLLVVGLLPTTIRPRQPPDERQ